MVSRSIPRIDVVEQAIAITGFTDDGVRSGHIDLDDLIPIGSIVLGWAATVTARFTGGAGTGAELTVGPPGEMGGFSAAGWHRLEGGAGRSIADVPTPASAVDNSGNTRKVRVTVRDTFDFGNITGGDLTLSVYFVRTVA